jgi:hypothetical protein
MLPKIACLSALLFAGCERSPKERYEFHPGGNGIVMWRCDRVTGQVSFCRFPAPVQWQNVSEGSAPIQAGAAGNASRADPLGLFEKQTKP